MRTCLIAGLAALVSFLFVATPSHAEVGRTKGAFAVSPSGAATYRIPIWVQPGPKGVQPSLALSYSSADSVGLVGLGWSLSGLSSIDRCPRTVADDSWDAAVNLDMDDRFCLSGNKLRLTSGTYGVACAANHLLRDGMMA